MVEQLKVETENATIYANHTKGSRYVTMVWKWKTSNQWVAKGWCDAGPEVTRMRAGETLEQFMRELFFTNISVGPVTGLPGHR
jgi:hypothetical protein